MPYVCKKDKKRGLKTYHVLSPLCGLVKNLLLRWD